MILSNPYFLGSPLMGIDWTLNPKTVVLTSCVYSLMPSHLSYLGKWEWELA